MITNATLTQIERRTGQTAMGQAAYAVAAVAVRCEVMPVTAQQRWLLGSAIKEVAWKVFLYKSLLATAGVAAPANGERITVVVDGEAGGRHGEIVLQNDYQGGSVSNFECFVKAV